MLSDLRSAWRLHRGQPAFTIFAILILAIGIGASTTVFSVANVVLLKSLPYPDSDRVMALFESRPRERMDENYVSIADFLDWRSQNTVFSDVAAQMPATYNLTGRGDAEQVSGGAVTARWFETLGARPALGSVFDASDEKPGGARRVVLTHRLWQRRFGGDPAIIGQPVVFNGAPHVIAGVLPAGFVSPVRPWEMFTAIRFDAKSAELRANHDLRVIARLKPGVSVAQARQEMDVISKRLEAAYQVNRGHYASVVPFDQAQRGKLRPAMRILMAAVGLVLLIACFNVSNLLLARATARAREISIRLAVGADRKQIARLLLTESLTMSVIAAGAGLLAAGWTIEAVRALVPPEIGLAAEDIRVDTTVLFFAVALALLTGVVFGFAPAFQASRLSLNDILRSGGQQFTAPKGWQRQRAVIVAGEMALSVLLLVGAGLLVRSFLKLIEVDPGFRADRILTMSVSLPASTYWDDNKKQVFQKQLIENVSRIPGVVSAGITSMLPVSGQDNRIGFAVEGIESDPREPRRVHWRIITPGYMETMQIALRRGRFFAESDNKDAPVAMVINEAAAKRYWPGRDPIGTHARLATMQPWATVVGVIADVRHWGLDEPARPEVYFSLWQAPFWNNNLVVRTTGEPKLLIMEVRRQLWALDRDLPPAAIRSMQEVIDNSTALRRFYMMLLTALAAIAVILVRRASMRSSPTASPNACVSSGSAWRSAPIRRI
jgi:predicted permease